jgi:hypothetical protein
VSSGIRHAENESGIALTLAKRQQDPHQPACQYLAPVGKGPDR